MRNERCFHVDDEDQIISTMSKYTCHRINSSTLKAPLHRAFSVFLLKPEKENNTDSVSVELGLLLQQRSHHKLTFPLLWANSCCSHPIDGLGESTPDVVTGVVKAARRKLNHELGIPQYIVSSSFIIYPRHLCSFILDWKEIILSLWSDSLPRQSRSMGRTRK